MKKSIAFFLSLIMIFSMSIPAFATVEEYPTIYVTGAQTNNIYSADNKRIYPVEGDIMETAKEALVPCLQKLAVASVTGDYSDFADEINTYILSIYQDVMLDENGEATDGSHPEFHSSTVNIPEKESGYSMWDYRFWYDWRLSPVTTAEELRDFIDRVISATGKDKVQLVGRCYGANVIQAYITLYKDHALKYVDDVAYYASAVNGIDFMSVLFTGDITVEDQALTNFIGYYLEHEELIEDDALSVFIFTLVELFNQIELMGLGTETIEAAIETVENDVLPTVLPSVIATWPSYWSMLVPEYYNKALDFMFGEDKSAHAEFIKKTDAYYNEVQLHAEDTIKDLETQGINFYIFTKYGFPDMPLYEGATIESDTYTNVPRQSFGAEASDYGKTFSDDYINSLEDKTYLSPDFKINAAKALIPERSWFIKNLHHNEFEVLHNMTLEIMRYDMTVENEKYPQYLYHENTVISPIEGPDEDYGKNSNDIISIAMRLIAAFFRVITNLLTGNLSFSLSI